jgi:surfactin synthase thioesterase subunit
MSVDRRAGRDGARTEARSRVLVPMNRPRHTELDLVLFPGGGNGPSAFSAWSRLVAPGWRLAAVCLPAREGRAGEDFPASIPAATREIASAIAAWRTGSAPLVYLGHSIGGWLAFDTALRLEPGLLVTAACAFQDGPLDYGPPDPERLRMTAYERGRAFGIDPDVMDEMVETTVTTMLGDTRMANGYLRPRKKIRCDVLASYGVLDAVPRRSWAECTTGNSKLIEVDGDHNFVKHDPLPIIEHINAWSARITQYYATTEREGT